MSMRAENPFPHDGTLAADLFAIGLAGLPSISSSACGPCVASIASTQTRENEANGKTEADVEQSLFFQNN